MGYQVPETSDGRSPGSLEASNHKDIELYLSSFTGMPVQSRLDSRYNFKMGHPRGTRKRNGETGMRVSIKSIPATGRGLPAYDSAAGTVKAWSICRDK